MQQKDYALWHPIKVRLNAIPGSVFFHEREVWWCAIGENVGFEQDGTSPLFTRPVLILKKFSADTCLIVPLTTKAKKGKHYFPLGVVARSEAVALLSQIRSIDRRRLTSKLATVDKDTFQMLVKAIIATCLPSLDT